jgi:hypothetical protein
MMWVKEGQNAGRISIGISSEGESAWRIRRECCCSVKCWDVNAYGHRNKWCSRERERIAVNNPWRNLYVCETDPTSDTKVSRESIMTSTGPAGAARIGRLGHYIQFDDVHAFPHQTEPRM